MLYWIAVNLFDLFYELSPTRWPYALPDRVLVSLHILEVEFGGQWDEQQTKNATAVFWKLSYYYVSCVIIASVLVMQVRSSWQGCMNNWNILLLRRCRQTDCGKVCVSISPDMRSVVCADHCQLLVGYGACDLHDGVLSIDMLNVLENCKHAKSCQQLCTCYLQMHIWC